MLFLRSPFTLREARLAAFAAGPNVPEEQGAAPEEAPRNVEDRVSDRLAEAEVRATDDELTQAARRKLAQLGAGASAAEVQRETLSSDAEAMADGMRATLAREGLSEGFWKEFRAMEVLASRALELGAVGLPSQLTAIASGMPDNEGKIHDLRYNVSAANPGYTVVERRRR